ncbi:O-antigen polymerase [Leptospira weilii]|uniref:Oligosaccharide repeat unit polymerase n=1 Tax=Leptospira weilii str. UI 13098 TaxID=1088542 RepID=M6QAH0_9LEPT|nr:O-antigen polymerase [Leptospira weilii]EMN89603.1 oligosaccharide repeat unit polymerase [Leptospira weilii str. UI 13098]OMI17056.1 hypothetical protein BUQ74_12255 [Leptospira weilii serovar Heyan]
MSFLILGFALLNISFSYFFLKKTSWVLILIQAYWFFWLFISSFSLTGLFVPSNFTYFLYIMLLSFVTVGAGIFKLLSYKRKITLFSKSYSVFRILTKDKEKYFFIFILIFIFPVVLFFFLKSIYLHLMPDAIPHFKFRAYAYGLYGESIVFGKNKYLYYYSLAVMPLIFASLFLGGAFFLRLNKIRILILASILVAMDTLIFLGRFGFYYVLIEIFFIFTVRAFRNRENVFKLFNRKYIFAVIGIFILIFFISTLRNPGKKTSFKEIINYYLIDYHTESFVLFDTELKNEKSFLYEKTYGRASLGGLERSFSFILGLFKIPLQVQGDSIGSYLHENRLLGYASDGTGKFYNAFGSVLFSIYKDGGIPFTIIMGILFGFLIAKFSHSFISLNPYYLSLLASLLYIGIFGIFKPVLSDEILSTILFLIIFWRL